MNTVRIRVRLACLSARVYTVVRCVQHTHAAAGDLHALLGFDALRRAVHRDIACAAEGQIPVGGKALAVG